MLQNPDGGMQCIVDPERRPEDLKLAPESIDALKGEINRYLAGQKRVELVVGFGKGGNR
jgi:hypothetical protein